ncbi:aminomethyl-transferring glycine dehydrogenase subunit GcvPA [Magnetofaba australis]|nr:aminomethyl-transferring glycine dehydrogenase subunit GcvPA [Magnetofaba australis]
MPFIPHTQEDLRIMLDAIGAADVEALFDEIPANIRSRDAMPNMPEALSEMALMRLMRERAGQSGAGLNFIGAGAYEHHIPAAVWEIAGRGEFYTAYTPYQAEASQGMLQAIWEFQSMMCGLTALEVSNASLYDGATALAEAILMAVRANPPKKGPDGDRPARVLIPASVHPKYRQVAAAMTRHQGIELVEPSFCAKRGAASMNGLNLVEDEPFSALVIPLPNFFGSIEDVDTLTDWAHKRGALVIAQVNPMALALLKPPGEWGAAGADIACGEGQPLGAPLSFGGPYFGFLTCRQKLARQMPGRIVGRTVDKDEREGFVLTLQAREQHIRRAKATSNICTNQGLMTVVAAIHLSLLGPEGLRSAASACHGNLNALRRRVERIDGVSLWFPEAVSFHEMVLKLPMDAALVVERMRGEGISAGLPLGEWVEGMDNALLVCVTETKTAEDLDRYAAALSAALHREAGA